MSEHCGSLRGVLVGLVAWTPIAVPIVTAGISPTLAALAASVVAFDAAYYRPTRQGRFGRQSRLTPTEGGSERAINAGLFRPITVQIRGHREPEDAESPRRSRLPGLAVVRESGALS